MNEGAKIFLAIEGMAILVFFFMQGCWLIDISVSAMNIPNAVITNGWIIHNPVQMYHVGVWMVVGSFFCLAGLTGWFMAKYLAAGGKR